MWATTHDYDIKSKSLTINSLFPLKGTEAGYLEDTSTFYTISSKNTKTGMLMRYKLKINNLIKTRI